MGLALLIVLFKSLALRLRDESYNEVARFWARIFALNFAMGVVTGIPMEFQFGTNWARFSQTSPASVVGQTLAMEGVFAFFLESAFLGLFLFGEKRLGPRRHLAAAVALFAGLVALGLLHHRHQRLHAAPGRATGRARTATCIWRTSGRISSTRGRSGSTPTPWRPRSSRPRSSSPRVGAYWT